MHRHGYDYFFDPRAGRRRRGIKCRDCPKIIRQNLDPRP
jgi:hypothetical protein